MSAPKLKKPSPVKPPPPKDAAAAFEKIKSELVELDPADLAVINLDIPGTVSLILGVLPNLVQLRPDIVAKLPQHPMHCLDNLENYALGAWYAHLLSLAPGSPDNPIRTLLDEAEPLRRNLLSDAEALANRKLLDAEAVAAIRRDQGHIDIANDLVGLSALLMASWDAISDKTAATLEEVKRAGVLGALLLAALGVREHGITPAPLEASDRRVRSYTLMVRAYDECQRAVGYLRWHHGDADEIAPSLYKGRGGRGSGTSDRSTGTEQPKTDVSSPITPAAGGEGPKTDE